MKYSFAYLVMILLGMGGIIIIGLFESLTLNNDSEYYVLKEAMEAAMLESIDLACFRNTSVTSGGCNGSIKISEQKFVENFTRRFATSVSGDANNYEIEFYDIIEMPPKATVVVKGTTSGYMISASTDDDDFSIVNNLTGILETRDWSVESNS